MVVPMVTWSPCTTGWRVASPAARIAAWSGVIIAVNCPMPYIRRLLMEKVAQESLSGVSLRARARAVRSCASRAISVSVLRSASRMTGTMSPSSMATATPMLTCR